MTQREIATGAVTHDFTATEVGAMGSMDMAYERARARNIIRVFLHRGKRGNLPPFMAVFPP